MLKAVNALRLNGSIERTRLQTIWLVTKIVAGAMVSVAATIFGYLQTKGG